MARLANEEIKIRNRKIRELCNQGMERSKVAKITNVSLQTVNKVMTTKEEAPKFEIKIDSAVKSVPRPFKPKLEVGQTVILKSIKRDQYGKTVTISEKKYTVAGVYSHHIRFERPGSNGNVIVKDYVWADLRYRLKLKGESVAC